MTTYYVDPAAGGANDGSSWTDAWTSLQSAADTASAGDIVYCRGTQTLTVKIDFDTNSGRSASGFIKFIGCNASGTVDGTRFALDGNSSATHAIENAGQSWLWFENVEVKNCTGDGIDCGTGTSFGNWVLVNCYSHDNSSDGIATYRLSTGNMLLLRCRFESNSGSGIDGPYVGALYVVCCSIKDNGAFGVQADWAEDAVLVGDVIHNNGASGIVFGSNTDGGLLMHNVIHENDDHGIDHSMPEMLAIIGNRITDNGKDGTGYGINCDTGDRAVYGWNYLDANTDGATNGNIDALPYDSDSDTNETSGTEGYNDGANDDFNLTTSATLRNTAIEID
jgi:hypothetical protein